MINFQASESGSNSLSIVVSGGQLTIREQQPGDVAAIRRVILEAFNGPVEADLVDKLRANGKFELSLVAELDGCVVGHILFTVVDIEGADPCPSVLGLLHGRY